jgi:putative mRNA 3-end processing factor
MPTSDLIVTTNAGLYCPQGDFHIDPWAPVPRAVITHAHGDHARSGSAVYLTADSGRNVLRSRLGPDARIETLPYGEPTFFNGVRVSLHPAGHILGSAQIRIEYRGDVWVASGDYKVASDRTCAPFDPVGCRVFITESTFGLPIYRWPSQDAVFADLNAWWRRNVEDGRASVVFAYSLGKAQRLLSGLDAAIGPIFSHGAVERMTQDYRRTGIDLPPTRYVTAAKGSFAEGLILAPPSARATPWLRRFGDFASAFVSGWMQLRGARRRRAVERGFVLSDHADWDGLTNAVRATGAERILVTHGSVAPMVRWFSEHGLQASAIPTHFEGELDEGRQGDAQETGESAGDQGPEAEPSP